MTDNSAFLSHLVEREDRSDGSIILRSGLELGPVANTAHDWLVHWAKTTPDRVFVAEREGKGWRELTYSTALQKAREIASGLLAQGMAAGDRLVVLSGPSVDHAILALATQLIGVVHVPLAEQYSLIPAARSRLDYCAGKARPSMVYAADGAGYADALAMDVFANARKCVSRNSAEGHIEFDKLAIQPSEDLETASASIGPETVAKILFTSGSTSSPKGVPITQLMMCINQAQYLACLPIMATKHHTMVDWLPWNHIFAGVSDFNIMLSNGGSWYLDDGKPVGPGTARMIENMKMKQGTLSFDVPVGHVAQIDALRKDADLRRKYCEAIDVFFYAGASLPPDVWDGIGDMCMETTGDTPLMMSSWGLTETAPAALVYYEKGADPGMVGVPVPELDVKLIPLDDERMEIRLRGPSIFKGYLDDLDKTAQAFDDEGFFITGDAMKFVDPDDMTRGLKFDGRIGEDFKLVTGTWVQATTLRLDTLAALSGIVQDLIIVGEGRDQVGAFIFPPGENNLASADGAVTDADYLAKIEAVLSQLAGKSSGSSNRVARAIVLAEQPSVSDGEITAKGSLNMSAIRRRRSGLLDRLYTDGDPAVINVKG